MTVVAVYIGGPLDGMKREEPRVFETRLHHVACELDAHYAAPVAYVEATRTHVYTRRIFRAQGGDVPFVFYGLRDMTDAQMMERLVEYYSPEPEEQR